MADDAHQMEQDMEIEALQAILTDEMREIPPDDPAAPAGSSGRCFQVIISPKDAVEEEPTDIPIRMSITFSHTPNYPDELPLLRVTAVRNCGPADVEELFGKITDEANSSLGMAMIFQLVTLAKDWMRERFNPESLQEQAENDAAKEEQRRLEAEEEKRRHGTKVTVETFLAWREMFEAEMALKRAQMSSQVAALGRAGKITGRKYFETRKFGDKESASEGEDDEWADEDDDEEIDEDDLLDEYLREKEVS
eukprot:jgi/Mesvir1/23556/Mv18253-RA.1